MKIAALAKSERLPLLVSFVVAFLLFPLAVVTIVNLPGSQKTPVPSSEERIAPRTAKPAAHFLTVEQPEDSLIVQSPALTVKGKTTAGSTVVIVAGEEMQLLEVGQGGNFSLTIQLEEGPTTIEVTSFDQTGEEKSVTREAFYTTETL